MCAQVGDAVDVGRPRNGGHEHLETGDRARLERRDEGVEQRSFLLREGRAKVLGDDLLARSVAQAPGERLGVADAHAGIGQRPRVLVDAERENGRLEGCDGELPLGKDPHHRRRQCAVLREDEVLGLHPVRRLAGMVVEDDDVDGRIAGDALELAQALRVHGLDDDQPPDRVQLDPACLEQLELIGVQAVELPDVPVQGAGKRDRSAGIQPPGGEHGAERVEVRVRVRDDDVHA